MMISLKGKGLHPVCDFIVLGMSQSCPHLKLDTLDGYHTQSYMHSALCHVTPSTFVPLAVWIWYQQPSPFDGS
jgi:hypothetical protein